MKKHLALVLALVMVLTSFSFVSAAPDFSDMNDQPSAEAVARLELLNVLKGYPDGTFRPEGEITRAEFAAVAVRISGLEGAAQSAQGMITSFSDVPAWHWASGYVGIAASSGIVNGIGNGLFAPEAPVKYEEAVTMLVRALGYEPEAQSKGGYPYGYLIVAEDIDLLDGLRGSLGVNATRGLVAQLTDNALEIPMMVSIGFGDNVRWVVSGTERNVAEQYLIEKMGFEPVEGRVTNFSTSRKTVTLEIYDEDGDVDARETYDVMDSFDYLETEGVLIKTWVSKDDLVVAYKLQETVYFDALEFEADDEDEITLVTLDDSFEVSGKIKFEDGELDLEADNDYKVDFAKIVVGKDGTVVWGKAYNLDQFIVVEEVDGNEIIAFDEYDEADLKDFDIMKDGKTIAVADIEEGDVVFLNNAEDFAVVYNSSEMGVIDRAYSNLGIRIDGTIYGESVGLEALYLEDGEMGVVDQEVLDAYVEEGEEVEVFFDFYGNYVLISGDKGTAKTSSYGLFLESAARYYQNARTGKEYVALDGVNHEGADVSFDVTHKILDDSEIDYDSWEPGTTNWKAAEEVVKYTVDEDGKLTKIAELMGGNLSSNDFKITDRFADSYRLKSGTVFFLLDEDKDLDEVFTLADADEFFEEVKSFKVYSEKGVYADYIVVYDSDAVADEEEVGVIARIRNIANQDKTELTININGTNHVIIVDDEEIKTDIAKGSIITFLINEEMDEVRDLRTDLSGREDLIGFITSGDDFTTEVSGLNNRQFMLNGYKYELDGATILDGTKATAARMSFSSIEEGSTVNVYYEGTGSTRFVKYLVVVEVGQEEFVPGAADAIEVLAEVEDALDAYIAAGGASTETAYTNVTAAETALETALADEEGISAATEALVEALAVLDVNAAYLENDKAKFVNAISNEVFENYVAANEDAYWTAFIGLDLIDIDTLAEIENELDIVNDVEVANAIEQEKLDAAQAVEDAADTGSKTEFLTALGHELFEDAYVAANNDAYWLAKATFNNVTAGADGNADVALVIAALVAVNEEEAVAAAIAKVPATLNPVEDTDTNVIDMVAAAIDDTDVTVAVDSSANANVATDGSISYTVAEVTGNVTFEITVGATSDTVIVSVVVPAAE